MVLPHSLQCLTHHPSHHRSPHPPCLSRQLIHHSQDSKTLTEKNNKRLLYSYQARLVSLFKHSKPHFPPRQSCCQPSPSPSPFQSIHPISDPFRSPWSPPSPSTPASVNETNFAKQIPNQTTKQIEKQTKTKKQKKCDSPSYIKSRSAA